MSAAAVAAIVLAVFAVGLLAGWVLPPHGLRPRRSQSPPVRRILLPFTGMSISRRALDAAIRLARAEDATLMPAYLAVVPRRLALDAPIEMECGSVMPLLEAIEQRATRQGIPVDSRIERGRTYRDALRRVLEHEDFDRVLVPASADRSGLPGDDIVWLLTRAPAEVVIVRPSTADRVTVSAKAVAGHF
ncbi:MAG: hypothetical protein QOJ07_3791 [Thermoleophilaceae bacterium]|nr:hypothetical protein [Thermoleophilaceae bacterium]